MTITIAETSDWKKLHEQGLETVVDPMVFRCGELFLKGASDVLKPDDTWDLLTKNLHAMAIFFDSLILNEKLPVFNYGDTFDMRLDFDQCMLTRINDYDEVFNDVAVEYGAYHEVKTAALTELMKVYEGPHKISPNLAREVSDELSAAEHQWNPSLGELEHKLQSEKEKQLAAFLLGGLIFGGYAQQNEC